MSIGDIFLLAMVGLLIYYGIGIVKPPADAGKLCQVDTANTCVDGYACDEVIKFTDTFKVGICKDANPEYDFNVTVR
jgi:hypothetical protein